MKTIKIFSILLLFFCICTGMKCKKNTTEPIPTLPAETQSGKNTFGCLVDGEVWLPKGNFPYSSLTSVIQFNILSLSARRSASESNESINISVREMTHIGDYVLVNSDNEFNISGMNYKCTEGIVTITKYDKENKITSGRFNAKGQNSTGQLVMITDGRFDVKYTD